MGDGLRTDQDAHYAALRQIPGVRWKKTVALLLLLVGFAGFILGLIFIKNLGFLVGIGAAANAIGVRIMLRLTRQAERIRLNR